MIGSTIVEVLFAVGGKVLRLLPFLAIAVPVAVYINHAEIGNKVRKVLDRGPLVSVFLATLIGALSPLCSCGVIPVVAAMLASGMPLAPVMAFWLASPSMDPEILLMSGATIGWELAIWRLAATFVLSFGGGLVVMLLETHGAFSTGILRSKPAGRLKVSAPEPVPALATAGASAEMHPSSATMVSTLSPTRTDEEEVRQTIGAGSGRIPGERLREYAYEAIRTAARLLAFMIGAYVLEEIITRTVPVALVATVLGRQAALAVPLATLVGVPMYATNLTALGIVAGLIQRGMDPAAALSFFVAGAVTTVPAIAAVAGIVRPRVFALYLGFAFAGALAAGYLWKLVHLL